MKKCKIHSFQDAGVRYWASDRRIPGSSAVEVFYYSEILCAGCGSRILESLSIKTDSYDQVRFDAKPVTKAQATVLRKDPWATRVETIGV